MPVLFLSLLNERDILMNSIPRSHLGRLYLPHKGDFSYLSKQIVTVPTVCSWKPRAAGVWEMRLDGATGEGPAGTG